nr:hypothetical protein [uncultured Desulfobulbus sp.]
MEISPLIPEIKALISSGQLDNQSQRPLSSFTNGQILQATVESQEAPDQFTLALADRKIPVETSTPLQTGQTISVKVTAQSPQLQFQLVDLPTSDQRISTNLHTLVRQGETFSQLPLVANTAPQLSQLSPSSRNTLVQMQAGLTAPGGTSQSQSLVAHIASNLLSLATRGDIFSSAGETLLSTGQLLQQLSQAGNVPSSLRQSAANMATAFLGEKGPPETAPPKTGANAAAVSASLTDKTLLSSDLRQQISLLPTSLQSLLQPLAQQFDQGAWGNDNRLLGQLLTVLVQVGLQTEPTALSGLDGPHLQKVLNNLGLNLEQSFAHGKVEDAAGTLKFALLELANLSSTSESQLQKIDELLNSLQFSQLMQMRLSPESLFFLPLPFPFLESGFLLIPKEKGRDGDAAKNKNKQMQENDISMHLQLEGLGNLHITIRQDKDQIALTFYTQDAERAKFMGEYREELPKMLTRGTLYAANFLVGAKEPVKVLLEKMLHAPTGMVNIKA